MDIVLVFNGENTLIPGLPSSTSLNDLNNVIFSRFHRTDLKAEFTVISSCALP